MMWPFVRELPFPIVGNSFTCGLNPASLVNLVFDPENLRDRAGAEQILPKNIMKLTKEEHIEVEGVVAVVLPGTMFRVELDNKHMVLATICGKMRKRWVRITAGDRVKMEMSPYDLSKARITWRLR